MRGDTHVRCGGRAGETDQEIRPASDAERARKEVAGELVSEIRSLDAGLKANTKAIVAMVERSGSTLTRTIGIGPVIAGRLIARSGTPTRFATSSAYANYAGTAPVEVASGQRSRHRLSRNGDRQLNSALHLVALTQVRITHSPGNSCYAGKIAAGKTPREAQRCLKRRLADHVWRTMIADHRRAQTGARGQAGATAQSGAAGPSPTANSLEKSLPGPAEQQPTAKPRPAA